MRLFQVKKGRGLHRAVIVGTGHMARDIRDNLERNRTSGMNVIGFVSESDQMPAETTIGDVPVIGTLSDLPYHHPARTG